MRECGLRQCNKMKSPPSGAKPAKRCAPLCRRSKRSCTSRCRCSIMVLSALSITWVTTLLLFRRREVSYGRGTRKVSEDRGLINYLMRHRHTTPFEMCDIKYHVKLPIFVARQWVRHRTANVNEYSARYSILDKEFYIPAPEHLAVQATTNRQGRGAAIDGEAAKRALDLLRRDAEAAYAGYAALLNEDPSGAPIDPGRPSLARELARINLSLGFYTQWYWKTDLHNLLHFLSLRADPHAQYEIRAYAEVMLDTLKRWVPMTYAAFLEYRMNAALISATGLMVIRRMIAGEPVDQLSSGLSPREWRELMAALERP